MTATKPRQIGIAHPGAPRFERLVSERYSLATLTGMPPEEFLRQANVWGSREAYERWLAAYRQNAGGFLDHPVWGADRDLGAGHQLFGAMDDRYASNAARLLDAGGLDVARHIEGKRACVVGAWDGTECLLLHALGASQVDAIEEAPASVAMATHQFRAWKVPGVAVECSLYEVPERPWLTGAYDLLYVPGVLYHLTDLPAALVILWSMLAPGGRLAFESIADAGGKSARYLGPRHPGWSWWSPSADCYEALLADCGFPDGRTVELAHGRGWWVGTRSDAPPLAVEGGAAGFSRPGLVRAISRGL